MPAIEVDGDAADYDNDVNDPTDVDHKAIWCALYKQSPGDEGWQVLGMINNYQRDAGDEDDRDSGSLSLLASLAEGDQVWVEWRGYGESFLYSNPYKLISFTGYLVTRAS